MSICFFAGHDDVSDVLYPSLAEEVRWHIERYGVTEFRVGNYGYFDRMALCAVKDAKSRYKNVSLYLVLPYWPEAGRPLPDLTGVDGTIYPQELDGVPYPFAIARLNRMMVADASYLIAYVKHSWGGAAKTLRYAKAKEKRGEITITNLF